jgi:hypothetical protein
MKINWFGLFPVFQIKQTYKENRKVEKTENKSNNQEDTYKKSN